MSSGVESLPPVGGRPISTTHASLAIAIAGLLFCLSNPQVLAQAGGTLRGTVQDPQQAAVPGATIRIHASGGLTPKTTVTDSSGTYRFEGVSAGTWLLEVSAPGFRRATRSLHVEVGIALVEDLMLEVEGFNDSVVVTATRSETTVARSPVSASVITQQDMEARPLQSVDQQLTLTEGVHVQRTRGPATIDASVVMRGFASASRTLVLLDGQPINDSYSGTVDWAGMPMTEISSVEVVRGPFSSLYGSNALAGVINIRTRPVERRQFELQGQFGTYDSSRVSAGFNDRMFNKLGVSLGVQRFRTAGYSPRTIVVAPGTGTGTLVTGPIMTRTTAGALTAIVGESGRNSFSQSTIRGKGEYIISPTAFVSLQYIRMGYHIAYDEYRSYLRDASGNSIDSGAVVFDDNGVQRRLAVAPTNFLTAPAEQHSNFYSATYQQAFSSGSLLRIDGSYYGLPFLQFRQPGTGSTLMAGPGTLTSQVRRNAHLNIQYDRRIRRHGLTLGAETRGDLASTANFGLGNWTQSDSILNQSFFAKGRSITQSAYVQDQLALSDRLSLVFGARHDYWKGYDGVADNFFNSAAPRAEYPERSNNRLNGKVALGLNLPQDWNLRLSVGTSFRNPNVFDLYSTSISSGVTRAGNPALKPETVNSWETGVRKRVGEGTSVDMAYYENRITNLVYRQTDLATDPRGNFLINVNAGAGRTRGLETAFRHQIWRGLQFRGTYTYTRALITKNEANPAIVGRRVTFIPPHMASGQLLGLHGKWTSSLSGRYVSKQFSSDTNTDTTKGVPGSYSPYFTTDAGLTYNVDSRWQVFASGENLLNRRYYTSSLSPGRTMYGGIRLRI
ncbi:MAG: TonB-dependent receptor [Vicinamibacterales bacterium]